MATVSARPVMKPASTDSEKKFETRPSLNKPAMIDIRPAVMASAAVSAKKRAVSGAASSETVANDMAAIADETATMSWREVPKMAYSSRPIGAA